MEIQEDVVRLADNSRLQEMLKRQMASVRMRTTSNLENERLQNILRKQMEYSKHQHEILIGENGRYHTEIRRKVLQMKKNEQIPSQDLAKLETLVQTHLDEIGRPEQLPHMDSWNKPGNVQKILNLIAEIANDIIEMKEQSHLELEEIEGKLMDERCNLKDSIAKLEAKLDRKKQHLQEIQTAIANEELSIKEEKRRHILAMKPKRLQLDRLIKRQKLCKQ